MHKINDKNSKLQLSKQRLNRYQQIEKAQAQWTEGAALLANEKAALGYKDFPWDAFLEIVPDDPLDAEQQSKIVELQDRYNELLDREELLWAEDRIVNEFNKNHAIVRVDQTYTLTEKDNSLGGHDFSLESRQSFKAFYEEETILCFDGEWRSKADIWLKSPRRRKYKGIIFNPTTTELTNDYYNLWKGFTKKPQQGNCAKFWAHVKENICNDDEDAYIYLRKWLACVFQHPDVVHTAIVLCGSQGVGKNSFVEPLGVLLGSHYAPLSSIHELVSNFNYHLKNAVLIHANEALWGGNKKEIGTIKAMITEQTCLIEGKGKDRIIVRNFKHVILSSNEEWPVHLDPDDRRFFILRVSDKHKEDHEYFKLIQDELDNGGYEALLYDLLHEDLTDFNPRRFPSSADSFAIKLRSADSSLRYLYEVLCEGGFSIGNTKDDRGTDNQVWQGPIPKSTVYEDYVAWCRDSGETISTSAQFGKAIKRMIPSVEESRPGKESAQARMRCYKFKSIQMTREDFAHAFKQDPYSIFEYEDVQR
jgi:hypothetical protein